MIILNHLGKQIEIDAGDQNDYIHKEIVATGQFFEQRLLDYLRLAYSVQRRVLDIGANFGNHSVFFREFLKCEALDCFEPQACMFDLLVKNVGDFATCHNFALGEAFAQGAGTYLGENNAGTWCISECPDGTIPIKPLDAFNFSDVTLIKIDVEWMELEVLKGAAETIKRCRPVIVLEAGTIEYLLPIAAFIEQFGYRCQWVRGLVPDQVGDPSSLGTTWILTP